MAFLDFLFGKTQPEKTIQVPTMIPQQEQLLKAILGQLGGPLTQGMGNLSQILSGSPEAFKSFEAPAMRQFQEQIVPTLAERFSSLGSGAQGSSAFTQSLGSAGADLSERMAAMRSNLQQNALSQLMSMTGMGLGARPFEALYQPERRDYGFLGAMAPGLGAGFGSFLGALPSQMYLSNMMKQFAPKPVM